MKFGLFYQLPVSRGQSEVERYRETLEQIERADALGFESVWLAESHFWRSFSVIPAPLTLAAALSGRTERIRIATGVVQLPLYDPLRVAEEAAMADVLSGGRLELGVGRGISPQHFEAFGVPWEERHSRFEEALEVIEGSWAADPLFHEGRHYRFDGLELAPRPVQRPRPPMHVAANSPGTASFAGRGGYGMLMGAAIHPLPDAFSAHVRRYREGLAEADGDRAKLPGAGVISSAFFVFCAKDGAEVRARFERSLRHHPVGRGLPWEVAEAGMAVFGNPGECAEKVLRIERETGLDRMLCHFNPGGLVPHEQVLEAMELFAAEVFAASPDNGACATVEAGADGERRTR